MNAPAQICYDSVITHRPDSTPTLPLFPVIIVYHHV